MFHDTYKITLFLKEHSHDGPQTNNNNEQAIEHIEGMNIHYDTDDSIQTIRRGCIIVLSVHCWMRRPP